MICGHCGHSVEDGSLTCEYCGTYLGKYSSASTSDTGVRAIRQGRVSASSPTLPPRRAGGREYGDYDLSSVPLEQQENPARRRGSRAAAQGGSSRPDTRRGVPVNAYGRAPHVRHKPTGAHGTRRRGVNWMLIGVLCVSAVLAIGIGAAVYISRSDAGQRATARRNTTQATEGMFSLAASKDVLLKDEREELLETWGGVSPQAYWLAGQDYLDAGEVEQAITCLRIGDVVDPGNYDGLLLLANTYELNTQDEEAEALYLRLVTEVAPFRTEAYTALVRMYQSQGRRPEAADMMKLGYDNTGKESFRLEREEYIPEPPQISLNAGRYQINKLEGSVHLTSPQGYDIYYTTDDNAVLPQEGKLSTDGSFLPSEGSVTLRAVCVSGDLSSDEVRVAYTFYYPSPPAPQCNLAPNTYKKLHEVKLRPGAFYDDQRTRKEKAEDEKHYVYHYTIDGSTPDENSPLYDGTPIKLPSGKVTLKAICINQYAKMSAIMEITYVFDVKPRPLDMYGETDVFTGFVLNKTNLNDFQQTFGQPTDMVDTIYLSEERPAKHLNYPWGYAVFALNKNAWELVRIEMNRSLGNAPRGVGFGSTEAEITAVYKDFGQPESLNGDRGLYYDYPRVGRVYAQADGSRMVQYSCQTAAGNKWVLQYWLQNGAVTKITHYYQP